MGEGTGVGWGRDVLERSVENAVGWGDGVGDMDGGCRIKCLGYVGEPGSGEVENRMFSVGDFCAVLYATADSID